MVKVILAEIRHFECPNEKVEENRLVTKSSILSMESLGWPNTQIHKYVHLSPNLHIHYVQLSTSLHERDHKVAGHLTCMGCPAKKIVPPSQGVPGANSDQ